ncbi:dihydrolipoamide acetyltransferase family protein [Glaciibacter sp. 2TAF33]|uniref:dihydrolipoamide acetyltransferase family protein n=1 Tax=Glaciibacter sp. 2TAF33 TaxID=3233015 RepID=UPI003F905CD3
MSDFLLPDLGEGLTEASIVSWLVQPGDTIAIDQPVVEVESAKSVVELPSPYGGVVERVFGAVGDVIHAGSVLVTVADAAPREARTGPGAGVGEGVGPGVGASLGSVDETTVAAAAASTPTETSGAVLVGYGTSSRPRPARRPVEGRFGRKDRDSAAPSAPATVLDPDRRSPVVSPLVRRLARENGFDASQLAGSGRDSLVVRGDVESFIRERHRAAATQSPAPRASEPVAVPTAAAAETEPTASARDASASAGATAPPEDTRIAITGLRKAVAQRMSVSRREIPEATIWMDVDATALFAARDQLLAATGERFSVTALIARFVVAALKAYPLLNSSVDTASQEILQHGAINLGIAAQTPRGLMVPVIHDAQSMTTRQLRDAVATLVTESADGSFAPSALAGGTFTLNNFGSLGVDGSAAIINHPEAAILGIGRMIERPWVVDHQLAVRTVVELSMVFDHRVCDGGTAAGFLTHVARSIESPVSLLAEL